MKNQHNDKSFLSIGVHLNILIKNLNVYPNYETWYYFRQICFTIVGSLCIYKI
jgi:hypothetical protein